MQTEKHTMGQNLILLVGGGLSLVALWLHLNCDVKK